MKTDGRRKIGAIILAGNKKIKRQLRRRKRRGLFYRISRPRMWGVDRKDFETRLASKINKDDYIVGENKSLLYLHPDLISQKNLNFLKRTLYFAGKTGDRIYRKNKKGLLKYLSVRGETPISLVLEAVEKSRIIDRSKVAVVGPGKQLKRELSRSGITGYMIADQGNSIGENVLIGKRILERANYSEEEVAVIGGDIPLLRGDLLDSFILNSRERGKDPDIRFGMGSRRELGEYIDRHDLGHMGELGSNCPKKGKLNKFGIPLVDDIGAFGKVGDRDHFMMGNIFTARFHTLNQGFIDRFYSLRKMGANPLTYPYLAWKFGRPLFRAVRWKLKLTEAERIFRGVTDVEVKVAPVPPPMVMDLDSYSDLRRLSALLFHRLRTTHDLEMDFKEYMRMKKRRDR